MSGVYIIDYSRTPIGRYAGALSSVRPDDMAARVIDALVANTPQLADVTDEVFFGCANQAGEDNRNVARMAVLLSGLNERVPAITLNRLCASGMDAVIAGYRAIRTGEADVVIAGGVESMSRAPFVMSKATLAFSRETTVHDTTIGWRFVNAEIERIWGIDSMPETAENVAEAYRISREDQDAFALSSQQRAAAAQASGRLRREIVPVNVAMGKGKSMVVDRDEHPRETTLEKLSALATPFRAGGTVTAGNAAGINDGAAALVLASEAGLARLAASPMAEILGSAASGVAPRLMGMGPVPAVQKLCDRLGLLPTQFDLAELNEAFAAQVIAVCRALDLDPMATHINPNGGAIALGHPLGMTGARLAGTAAMQIDSTEAQLALCTLCVGVGQGVALVLSKPGRMG